MTARLRDCDECGERYTAKTVRSRYCSDRCKVRRSRTRAVRFVDPRRALAQELLQLTVAAEPVPITTGMVDALLVVLDKLNNDELDADVALDYICNAIQGRAE